MLGGVRQFLVPLPRSLSLGLVGPPSLRFWPPRRQAGVREGTWQLGLRLSWRPAQALPPGPSWFLWQLSQIEAL